MENLPSEPKRLFLGDFDLPITGGITSWEWSEKNIESLAALFQQTFKRNDLVIWKYEEEFQKKFPWGLGYSDYSRLPLFTAASPRELGQMGLTYLTGYRNAQSLLEEQARWINAAKGALAGVDERRKM